MKPGQSLKCWFLEYDANGKPISVTCEGFDDCNGKKRDISCGEKKCKEFVCPQFNRRKKKRLDAASTGEQIAALCPNGKETGLKGWSIIKNQKGEILQWTCKGECNDKVREVPCGEKQLNLKLCIPPICPVLTDRQKQNLSQMSFSELGQILCP